MTDAAEVFGAYRKLTSRPVVGCRRGGRKVPSVWGMENVRCLMRCPIRVNASRREGRVRALGEKVKRVLVKRAWVVNSQHSDAVSLKEQMVAMSMCERRIERMPSNRQRRSRDGLVVAIT